MRHAVAARVGRRVDETYGERLSSVSSLQRAMHIICAVLLNRLYETAINANACIRLHVTASFTRDVEPAAVGSFT